MKRDKNLPTSAIWLLGDSPPFDHEHCLDEPLDWRFPTRHNIWTPIETVINRELFVHNKSSRIDDRKFYVRNAVKTLETWQHEDELHEEVLEFGKLAEKHRPFLILTFGRRAFEFARRSTGGESMSFSVWSVQEIQKQFDAKLSAVPAAELNLLPLLHASVARQFQHCHEKYGGNYYENVGRKLATIFKAHREDERLSELWM